MSDAPPAVAIATVTAIGYLGSFSGPPAVGVLAELSTLPIALGLLVLATATMTVLAPGSLRRDDPIEEERAPA